jgi:hypothetical protein
VLPGEAVARLALERAFDANFDLAETEKAYGAHLQMHRIGEYVSGLYGCWHQYDEGIWYETCLVRLAHIPLGHSAGFIARRLCSICREDISECEHLPGRAYPVVAARDESDNCTVCGDPVCDHELGETYKAYQYSVIADATLLEASLTPNPREPRARFMALELDPQLPPPRNAADRHRCSSCILPCPGFAMPSGVELAPFP